MAKKVVIADDQIFFRLSIKDILTEGGYDVVGIASNGIEAVDLVKKLKPDLVILDMVMPEMTGIEAAEEIAKLNLPTKIVFCSSLGQDALVEEAIKAGAKAYILKPLDEPSILKTLADVLEVA